MIYTKLIAILVCDSSEVSVYQTAVELHKADADRKTYSGEQTHARATPTPHHPTQHTTTPHA